MYLEGRGVEKKLGVLSSLLQLFSLSLFHPDLVSLFQVFSLPRSCPVSFICSLSLPPPVLSISLLLVLSLSSGPSLSPPGLVSLFQVFCLSLSSWSCLSLPGLLSRPPVFFLSSRLQVSSRRPLFQAFSLVPPSLFQVSPRRSLSPSSSCLPSSINHRKHHL